VYVVPDFDSTEDVIPQTLRTSTGGRVTLTGLTPGNYHVFTFDRPVALEFRNPEVLAALPSQAVSLEPNAEAELAVEVHLVMPPELAVQAPFVAEPQGRAC